MRKNIILFILLCFAFAYASAQTELSPSDWKMTQAKLLFEDNRSEEALVVYNELIAAFPNDALLNFRIAECYNKALKFEKASEYLATASQNCKNDTLIKEVKYLQGCVYHQLKEFDKAKLVLSEIIEGTATVGEIQVKKLLSQIDVAKNAYDRPSNYFVFPAGEGVNTEYNEIFPVCSRYNSKLYITIDKPVNDEQAKNAITNNFPFSIFETIVGEGGKPGNVELVDETFASGRNYILSSVTAADKVFYLYRYTPEDADGGDIWYDTKDTDEDFTDAVRCTGLLNSEFYEFCPSLDFINNHLFFISSRKSKVKENCDIYDSDLFKGDYTEAGIISELNSDFNESFVYVHPGGDFLVFASDCEKSMGGDDLFISYLKDGKWTVPVNMGYPINSMADDSQFSLSSDGKYAYISSNREGSIGGFDIFVLEAGPFFAENTGSIPVLVVYTGQIMDDEGTGVVCDLKISNLFNSKDVQQVKTDSLGYYSFAVRGGSKYSMQIKAKNFVAYSEEFDLMKNSSTLVEKDFELVTKP